MLKIALLLVPPYATDGDAHLNDQPLQPHHCL